MYTCSSVSPRINEGGRDLAGPQSVKLYQGGGGGWCMYNSPFDILRLILSNLYYTMPFVYVINFVLVKGEERGQWGGEASPFPPSKKTLCSIHIYIV